MTQSHIWLSLAGESDLNFPSGKISQMRQNKVYQIIQTQAMPCAGTDRVDSVDGVGLRQRVVEPGRDQAHAAAPLVAHLLGAPRHARRTQVVIQGRRRIVLTGHWKHT